MQGTLDPDGQSTASTQAQQRSRRMHQVEAHPSRTRRFRSSGLALVAITAAVSLAACGSSGSSSSSSSAAATSSSAAGTGTSTAAGTSSASGGTSGLKTGLKVFVIPKNLGNSYFTVADSVKSGGALSVRSRRSVTTGTETSGSAATSASQLPAIQAAIAKGANVADRVGHRPDGPVPDPQAGDGPRDHGRHLRLRRADLPRPVRQPGLDGGRSGPARSTCWPRRCTTRARSGSSRRPPRRPTRTPGSGT